MKNHLVHARYAHIRNYETRTVRNKNYGTRKTSSDHECILLKNSSFHFIQSLFKLSKLHFSQLNIFLMLFNFWIHHKDYFQKLYLVISIETDFMAGNATISNLIMGSWEDSSLAAPLATVVLISYITTSFLTRATPRWYSVSSSSSYINVVSDTSYHFQVDQCRIIN